MTPVEGVVERYNPSAKLFRIRYVREMSELAIETCIYRYEDGRIMLILYYVDDIISDTTDGVLREIFFDHIRKKWAITTEGQMNRFLGISYVWDREKGGHKASAVTHIENECSEARHMKHVDVKFRFVQESIKMGEIRIRYISTEFNWEDVLTKTLVPKKNKDVIELIIGSKVVYKLVVTAKGTLTQYADNYFFLGYV